MDDKQRCQSCGMPMTDEKFFGTEADGAITREYCRFCYQNGAFMDPDQTMEGMIQSSVGFMTSALKFSPEDAERLSRETIPQLRRWKR
jgi:hypothetical protein